MRMAAPIIWFFAQRVLLRTTIPGEQQDEGRDLRQHLRGGGGKIEERGAEQPEVADQAEDADEDEPAVCRSRRGRAGVCGRAGTGRG